MDISTNENNEHAWQVFYRLAGVAALVVVVTGIAEIGITFLPGGNVTTETVVDWFQLLQTYPFMGLRNLGLLNIIMVLLAIPVTLAISAAHWRVNKPLALLAMLISFIGVATFYGTNRAFPMLDLSQQYAVATTDAQRAALIAAGQSMLSVGQSHTPGTFLAFFLAEIAGLMMGFVVLRGGVFGKAVGVIGIVGNASFIVFEVMASFFTGVFSMAMGFALVGGLLSMAWNVLIALGLFRIAQGTSEVS